MDTIGNMLTSIRNAQAVKKETVKVPYSNFKLELIKVFESLGFVAGVDKGGKKEKRYLEIKLRYDEAGKGAIRKLVRISKPGRKTYSGYRDLRWGQGSTLVVSTSQGPMTVQESKKKKLGGELICLIS
jgi:small subunit ribosomal protein S8